MHGLLSLAVLVVAFACVAAGAAYVCVRLYRAFPAGRAGAAGPDPEAARDEVR